MKNIQAITDRFNELFNLDLEPDFVADEVVETLETIQQFKESRNGWADYGRTMDQGDGYISIAKAQALKGQPRCDLYIIEYDGYTYVYKSI